MKAVAVYSYIIFFSFFIWNRWLNKNIGRSYASNPIASCEQFIKPFLDHQKVTKDFMEVFEKGYLTKEEVLVFKESEIALKAVDAHDFSFEERNYSFAIMALLKKRYHYLDIESTINHYKAIYKKCS